MVKMLGEFNGRKRPTVYHAARILRIQRNKCFYCGFKFGDHFMHKGTLVVRSVNWEHVVPYSYCFNSGIDNLVAACGICNGIKSDLLFDTPTKAQIYVREQRTKRKLKNNPVPQLRDIVPEKEKMAAILQIKVQGRTFLDDA